MDICSLTIFAAVFLPLLFAIYLIIAKLGMFLISKKTLDWGLVGVNFVSFLLILITSLSYISDRRVFFKAFEIFNFKGLSFSLDFILNSLNLKYLFYSSLIFFLISIFLKIYFKERKQFLFTKQRFYTIFLFLISTTYLFFTSYNIIQSFALWSLIGVMIFIFAFFDLFKNNSNSNITRFYRLILIGDIFLFISVLFILKNIIPYKGETTFFNLYDIFNSYGYDCEYKVILVGIFAAILSRFVLIPFNCFYSFFANSSNLLFLIVSSVFPLSGIYLFEELTPAIGNFVLYKKVFIIICVLSFLISLFLILFEKNIKIIFGLIYGTMNAFVGVLGIKFPFLINIWFFFNLVILGFLFKIFSDDRINFEKRIINRYRGFFFEKINIFVFEKIPSKIASFLRFVDAAILLNIPKLILKIYTFFFGKFALIKIKTTNFKLFRNILIIFLLYIVLIIVFLFFGGMNVQ